MPKKITLDGKEYEYDRLSGEGKSRLNLLTFSTQKISELNNLQALLQRAKNSYINSLKKEMLSQKSGFLFNDD